MIVLKLKDRLSLNEIDSKHAEDLSGYFSRIQLQPNGIFGNRNRILLPFTANALVGRLENYPIEARAFLEFLSRLVNVDLETKTIRNDKFPNGLKIMKFIDRIASGKEGEVFKGQFDFAVIKRQLELSWNNLTKGDVYFIATRFPMDVVRMSDHGALRSCHSKGKDYYTCAIQEATGYGFVVFGVQQPATQEWLDANESSEIFGDTDRPLKGLTPIYRTRCRYFKATAHDSNNGIAEEYILYTREDRHYGNSSVSGVVEGKLVQWLKSMQAGTIKTVQNYIDNDGEAGFSVEFQRAVSYSDTNDTSALSELLDRKIPNWLILNPNEIEIDDSLHEGEKIDERAMHNIIAEITSDWNSKNAGRGIKLQGIWFDIEESEDNGDEYASLSAAYRIDIGEVIDAINNSRETPLPKEKILYFLEKANESNRWGSSLERELRSFIPGDVDSDGDGLFYVNFNSVSSADDVSGEVDLIHVESFLDDVETMLEKLVNKYDPHGKFEPPKEGQANFPFYDEIKAKPISLNERKAKIRLTILGAKR